MFAKGFIRAGTVILTETPRAFIPDEACFETHLPAHVRYALFILSGACGPPNQLLEEMRGLHPVSSRDVPESHRGALLEEYSPHFDGLFSAAVAHGCDVASVDDILVLLCRLRFNCFSSGLYIISSLVNHSCQPNCSKFSRSSTAFDLPVTEFVATRDIFEGEEISISYFGDVELSHLSRSRRFLSQHCAKLPATPFPAPLDQPPEGIKENELEDLELALDALVPSVHSVTAADHLSIVSRLRDVHTTAAALCGPGHFVCIRILRMLVSVNTHVVSNRHGGDLVGVAAALEIVQDGMRLLPAMESYLGGDHCDVATLLLDVSNALEHLFASGDKRIFALDGMQTYSAASRRAYAMKQRSQRIQQLYAAGNS